MAMEMFMAGHFGVLVILNTHEGRIDRPARRSTECLLVLGLPHGNGLTNLAWEHVGLACQSGLALVCLHQRCLKNHGIAPP